MIACHKSNGSQVLCIIEFQRFDIEEKHDASSMEYYVTNLMLFCATQYETFSFVEHLLLSIYLALLELKHD